jgi:hypothetical protein
MKRAMYSYNLLIIQMVQFLENQVNLSSKARIVFNLFTMKQNPNFKLKRKQVTEIDRTWCRNESSYQAVCLSPLCLRRLCTL